MSGYNNFLYARAATWVDAICCAPTSNLCHTPLTPKTPSPRYCCWNRTQLVGFNSE
jgi:hypothetical protein